MGQSTAPDLEAFSMPRPANVTDLPMLYRSELQYMREIEPDHLDGWVKALDRNLEMWTEHLSRARVIDLDHTPTGIMLWMPTPEPAAVLVTLHVLPEARRRGLGRILLQQFITDATAAGHPLLSVGVHEDNPIRNLYQQAGFDFTHADGQYLHYEIRRSVRFIRGSTEQ